MKERLRWIWREDAGTITCIVLACLVVGDIWAMTGKLSLTWGEINEILEHPGVVVMCILFGVSMAASIAD